VNKKFADDSQQIRLTEQFVLDLDECIILIFIAIVEMKPTGK